MEFSFHLLEYEKLRTRGRKKEFRVMVFLCMNNEVSFFDGVPVDVYHNNTKIASGNWERKGWDYRFVLPQPRIYLTEGRDYEMRAEFTFAGETYSGTQMENWELSIGYEELE